jgi:electron-transferring-flavoprotein dehydrogenase
MKHHPFFKDLLEGGECLAYGARVLNEGGLQSIPKLYFPGGALIGCSAGFLNVPKIKGTHNAMKSGMLAAEAAIEALDKVEETGEPIDMSGYEQGFKDSWIHEELHEVRNLRPSFHNPLGLWGGMAYSGVDSLFLKGRVPWTFRNSWEDYQSTKPAR